LGRRFFDNTCDGTDLCILFSSWASYNLLAGCTVCQNSTLFVTYVSFCNSEFVILNISHLFSWGTWQMDCGDNVSTTTLVLKVSLGSLLTHGLGLVIFHLTEGRRYHQTATLSNETAIPFWAATNRMWLSFRGRQGLLTLKHSPDMD
jgi:hypothetical protein